ncbi:MAG: hypothetical protein RL477_1517 [Pseudomonadota bacterium]|jgi:hypothetical protein
MPAPRKIARADVMDMGTYEKVRAERRRAMMQIKRHRRVAVGPNATFYFENYDTMLYQVHEMVRTERGGEEQIADEIAAYNPLIPQGRELVATMMIEYEDPVVRDRELRRLTFIEKTVTLAVGPEEIRAVAETDLERTKADGKTSAIHFLRFPLTDSQAAVFKTPGTRIVLGIGHENYGHMAVLPEATRSALAADLA